MADSARPSTDALRGIPVFEALDDVVLTKIASVATEFDVPGGHVLVQPGQEGTGLFFVEAGSAIVEVGSRQIECGPGECIGELSLFAKDIRHVARVRAATELRGIAIMRDDFLGLMEGEPGIALGMLRVLAHRLAETDQLLARS